MLILPVVLAMVLLPAQGGEPFGLASIRTGSGAPSAGLCTTQRVGHLFVDISVGRLYSCDTTGTWKASATSADVSAIVVPPAAGMPSGAVFFITSGNCPNGTTEATELNGRVAVGTLAANGNVGGTGGSDTITPAGTVAAPTFTGQALGTHAHQAGTLVPSAHAGTAVADHASHTHTYTQIVNHTHPLATGTTATGNFAQVIGTVDTSSGGTGGSPTQTALGTLSGNPAGGVASGTTAGPSATLTHGVTQPNAHTMSGSSEAVSGGTPAGTNSAPAFTGTQFDNRPAFVRVIACRAN